MSALPRQEGMTLIELMIVVAIIGILASVAVFMFGKSSKKTKFSTEVAAMMAEFKLRQESYLLENGTYFSTGTGETDAWPTTPSTTSVPTSIAPMPAEWTTLRMSPDKTALYCSYVSIAGAADDNTNIGTVASSDFSFSAPSTNWYYILAQCDMDKNSTVNSYYFTRSDREGMAKLREYK